MVAGPGVAVVVRPTSKVPPDTLTDPLVRLMVPVAPLALARRKPTTWTTAVPLTLRVPLELEPLPIIIVLALAGVVSSRAPPLML
jgi:hypothetical protein